MSMSTQAHAAPRTHWWLVFVTGTITVITGTLGFLLMEDPHHEPFSIWKLLDALYNGLQMLVVHKSEFITEHSALLEISRWLGVFTFLATAWLLLVNRLRQEIRILQLRFWDGHYVICGLSAKAVALIESLKARDEEARIVVIEPDPDPDLVHRCQHHKVCLLKGDATEEKNLKQARIGRAREILAISPDDEVNIRVAAEVRSLRGGEGNFEEVITPAFCRAHITKSHLPEALQKWTDARSEAHTTLRFFDVYDSEARRVFLNAGNTGVSRSKIAGVAPLDGPGIAPADGRSVHVVIMGMGSMGSALLVRAAKMGHFANGKKMRITVIDRDAHRQRGQLFFRYPILAQENDFCELHFHQWQADSLEAREFIEACARETDTVLHTFVCLDSNARSAELGLRLWEMVSPMPESYVYVRITSHDSMGQILRASNARIQSFGMIEDTCSALTVLAEPTEALARIIHEDFVASRRAVDAEARKDDPAMAPWERLREDYRESNRQQADHMGIKMRAIGCRIIEVAAPGEALTAFTAQEIETLAQLEHRRWNAERWLNGWRYGAVTDAARRIHSCLVPWGELSEQMKGYDRQTVQKLPKWLAAMKPAMKVVRGMQDQ